MHIHTYPVIQDSRHERFVSKHSLDAHFLQSLQSSKRHGTTQAYRDTKSLLSICCISLHMDHSVTQFTVRTQVFMGMHTLARHTSVRKILRDAINPHHTTPHRTAPQRTKDRKKLPAPPRPATNPLPSGTPLHLTN
ncbi:hypothetical protein CC78DRAFT_128718 [Lojkania enalia]|uniref:Uncharacterized protein n=1 Tax=Lojkania enalia TaxID=147567 RepID=A0A9P4K003_9PLEO|nr:hypothetical protein CC78DRAFT_128718 [Didymosphaeria enalia]